MIFEELGIDKQELINLAKKSNDFILNNHRFIKESEINLIQQEELAEDPYLLGYFNANFLSDILNLSSNAIQVLQENNAFDEIGQAIIDNNKIDEFQYCYSQIHGYSHHFNQQSNKEEEIIIIEGINYYVFPSS